jgi:hypothetical protein
MLNKENSTDSGKVDYEKSFYDITDIELLIEECVQFLFQSGSGIMTGSNGDSY